MRVGIYNLHWTTFGGGEQQAGGLADALAGDHEVELLGPDALDPQELRSRLGLRLEGVRFRKIPADSGSATFASADYDLFFNHTYGSTAHCLAPHGIYFVMFPHQFRDIAFHRGARRIAVKLAERARVVSGVHPRTDDRGAVVEGPVLVHVAAGVGQLNVEFDATVPEQVPVAIIERGASVRTVELSGRTSIQVDLADRNKSSDGVEVLFGAEPRGKSSLRLTRIELDGRAIGHASRSIRQRLVRVRPDAFLDTYDHVVALSDYTLGWTRRWWGRGEAVLSPPVRMRMPGTKEKLIVAVGRFFDEASGHSKQQLKLVKAFRMLIDRGVDGWRLVLVGGCNPADRAYAMAVRREARGLPVEVHLNAPGEFLDDQLAKATILWHAAGLGVNLEAHPERAEHFGIAPIEAMSAGVVPLVFGAAGPTEVVEHRVNGLHFHSVEELVNQTLDLIADPDGRQRLAAAAIERAHQYDTESFQRHVRDLVSRVTGSSTGPTGSAP